MTTGIVGRRSRLRRTLVWALSAVLISVVGTFAPGTAALAAPVEEGYRQYILSLRVGADGTLEVSENFQQNVGDARDLSVVRRIGLYDDAGRIALPEQVSVTVRRDSVPFTSESQPGMGLSLKVESEVVRAQNPSETDYYPIGVHYRVKMIPRDRDGFRYLSFRPLSLGVRSDDVRIRVAAHDFAPYDSGRAFDLGPCRIQKGKQSVEFLSPNAYEFRYRNGLSANEAFEPICLAWRQTDTALIEKVQREVVRIPAVGCQFEGQAEVAAPPASTIAIVVDPKLASRLAFYRGESGPGVLAPRGWRCVGSRGSGGSTLIVQPTAIRDTSTRSLEGPVVALVERIGGTSGRSSVAEIAEGLFPDYRSFVDEVKRSGAPFNGLKRGSADRLRYKDRNIVEFETPAGSEGLGTYFLARTGTEAISGVVMAYGAGSEPNVRVLSTRLPSAHQPLVQEITRQVEVSVTGTNNVNEAISESADVSWQALKGDWGEKGACDGLFYRVLNDGKWRTLRRQPDGSEKQSHEDILTITPARSEVCAFPPESDNGGCYEVRKLTQIEFEGSYQYSGDSDAKAEPFSFRRCQASGSAPTVIGQEKSSARETATDLVSRLGLRRLFGEQLLLSQVVAIAMALVALLVAIWPGVSLGTRGIALIVLIAGILGWAFPRFWVPRPIPTTPDIRIDSYNIGTTVLRSFRIPKPGQPPVTYYTLDPTSLERAGIERTKGDQLNERVIFDDTGYTWCWSKVGLSPEQKWAREQLAGGKQFEQIDPCDKRKSFIIDLRTGAPFGASFSIKNVTKDGVEASYTDINEYTQDLVAAASAGDYLIVGIGIETLSEQPYGLLMEASVIGYLVNPPDDVYARRVGTSKCIVTSYRGFKACGEIFHRGGVRHHLSASPQGERRTETAASIDRSNPWSEIAVNLCETGKHFLIEQTVSLRSAGVSLDIALDQAGALSKTNDRFAAWMLSSVRDVYLKPQLMDAALRDGRWEQACVRYVLDD